MLGISKAEREKRASNKDWLRRNKEQFKNYTKEQFVEHVDFMEVIIRDGYACGICGELVPWNERNLDHIIPLARGGTHEYSNVQLAHLRCSNSKGAKMPKGGG